MSSDTKPLLGDHAGPKTLSQRLRAAATPAVLKMAFYTVCYVLSGVVNSIYLKKLMNNLNNYPFFLNQVTNYGYIPIFGAVVLYELKFTKLITKDQRDFPWWKFFTMGVLDAINGYIVVIGGVGTSGTMQQLLNQAIIPVTMIGSFIFLKERYSLIQIGGSLLIVGGVALSLLPSLTNSGGNSGNILFFNMFFLCQAIPFAASNLYKDIAFKSVDMDVWYLQFWDVFYQSVIGTFLFPINTVLPKPANIEWKEIPSAMKNGGICLSGVNVITTNCGLTQSDPCDNCYHAWLTLMIYMIINVTYNIFILLVIKHGSATVLSIAQTVRLPLTSIAFSQKWIMQKQSEPFSKYSLYGLFIILAGLTTFRAGSLLKRAQTGDADGSVKIIPRLGPGGTEIFSEAIHSTPLILPKTTLQHRQQYFSRLGIVQ
jgi:drug/metabolite transporter (DMT)-like permease